MADRDYRKHYVDRIKNIVDHMDESIDDSVLVTELEELAKSLRRSIENLHSAIYVAVYDDGPDDDFTRVYVPLGTMTCAEAKERLGELTANTYDGYVKEITEEEWDDLIRLRYLTEILFDLKMIINHSYDAILQDTTNDISTKVTELRDKVGFKHRWEVVG